MTDSRFTSYDVWGRKSEIQNEIIRLHFSFGREDFFAFQSSHSVEKFRGNRRYKKSLPYLKHAFRNRSGKIFRSQITC